MPWEWRRGKAACRLVWVKPKYNLALQSSLLSSTWVGAWLMRVLLRFKSRMILGAAHALAVAVTDTEVGVMRTERSNLRFEPATAD